MTTLFNKLKTMYEPNAHFPRVEMMPFINQRVTKQALTWQKEAP